MGSRVLLSVKNHQFEVLVPKLEVFFAGIADWSSQPRGSTHVYFDEFQIFENLDFEIFKIRILKADDEDIT